MKTDNLNFGGGKTPSRFLDLGNLYNLTQILHIHIDKLKTGSVIDRKRKFTEKSIEEFKYLLHNRLWEDIFLCNDINTVFNAFMSMSISIYYFKRAFHLNQFM